MKGYKQLLAVVLFGVLLTACSVDENAADLYKKEPVLDIDIVLPEPIVQNEPLTYKAVLQQDGKMVEDAQDVQFTFWKNAAPDQREQVTARNEGNGIYSAEKTLEGDGLYFVKVQATANGSTVMPTKQFGVGELTEEEKAALQNQDEHQHHGHDAHH